MKSLWSAFLAIHVFAWSGQFASAQVTASALVRHAPTILGNVEGSIQQALGESVVLNGGSVITDELAVPGTPAVHQNGHPTFNGVIAGTGDTSPTGYEVTLDGNARLGHLRTQTNPKALTALVAPTIPSGARSVSINKAGQDVGDWRTLRNLTLNGGVGQYAVPPGTYGDFAAGGASGFTLGTVGSTQPALYEFQRLTLNGNSRIAIVGPVVIRVRYDLVHNAAVGTDAHPDWLDLQISNGSLTLNGGARLCGYVLAPNGTVTINGGAELSGGVESDRLVVNGRGLLRLWPREGGTPNHAPVANLQTVVLNEDTATPVVLGGYDPDNQALSFTITANPSHGTLSGVAPNLTYTPQLDYNGEDSFSFVVSDGLATSDSAVVSLTISAVNDAPVAHPQVATLMEDSSAAIVLSGTDVDSATLTYRVVEGPQHGALDGTVPNLVYTPAADYHGEDSFSFVVNDGELDSEPATILIHVASVPDAPVAVALSLQVFEDQVGAISLSGRDADGDVLSFSVVGEPLHGVLGGIEPSLSYSPDPNYFGPDEFTYTASDGLNPSAPARVDLTVIPVNDPPDALPQTIVIDEDTEADIHLAGVDVDGDPLTYRVVDLPLHGTLSQDAAVESGWRYTPFPDFHGVDAFSFVANDGAIDSAPAGVTIEVRSVNDVPVALPQTLTATEDTVLDFILAASDADDDALAYEVVTQPSHGALAAGVDGMPHLTYSPAPDYHGADTFAFRVFDGAEWSDPAVVTINIAAVNDVPVVDAGPDQSGVLGTAVTLAGAVTDDGDPEQSVVVTHWAKLSGPGLVQFNDAGSPSTSAQFGAAGTYELELNATDGELTSTDQVTVVVAPGNQAPTVDAGPDQSLAAPGAAFLIGTASDDGLPSGSSLRVAWTKVSGPGAVSFTTPQALTTGAVFAASGRYVIRLVASDGSLAASDDLVVQVAQPNQAPQVATLAHVTAAFGESVLLSGTVSDDGFPAGTGLAVHWSQVSGPGQVTFSSPAEATTAATFSMAGTYAVRLEVSDSVLSSTSDVTVVVQPPANRGPVVDAGPDQVLDGIHSGIVSGKVSDDGLPAGSTVNSMWSVVSGPGPCTFTSPSTAQTSFAVVQPGSYVFRLTASDGEMSSSDDLTVTLQFSNQAPQVDAGLDVSAVTGRPITLAGRVTDDELPSPSALVVEWRQISGPAAATIASPTTAATSATFSTSGTYVLELTANDTLAQASDQLVVTVVDSVPLTVSIVEPVTDSIHHPGQVVTLRASATGGESPIGPVQFFANDQLISTSAEPYTASFVPAAPGIVTIRGSVQDAVGTQADSATVRLKIEETSTVAASLSGLRWELPSLGAYGPRGCYCSPKEEKTTALAGAPDVLYDIQLHLRGLVERKTYIGGTTSGFWQVGGSPDIEDGYNVYALEVSDPHQVYYVNAGTSGTEQVSALDYTKSIKAYGGATIRLWASPVDALEISNYTNIVVPGVSPAPQAYNGQFVQVDVDSVLPTNSSNAAPVVDAGADLTLTGSQATATLHATVSDDGLPVGGTAQSWWRIVQAPARFTAPGLFQAAYDFQTPAAVGSAWTYGWTDVRGGPVTAFATFQAPAAGLENWSEGTGANITVNRTTHPIQSGSSLVVPGEVNLHPGQSGRFAVARWTAPEAGTYAVVFQFTGRDNTTTDAAVLQNQSRLWQGFISCRGDIQGSRSLVTVAAGDQIDFVVGRGPFGTYVNDSTGLEASISKISGPDLSAVFDSPGQYVLRHEATDGERLGWDDVNVLVNGTGRPNAAPTVRAFAAPVTGITGQSLSLSGEVSDDGLPVGSSLASWWTMVSGPSLARFAPTVANARRDFVSVPAPTGSPWAYGWSSSRGGALQPFASTVIVSPDVTAWTEPSGSGLMVNRASSTVVVGSTTFPADMLVLHPASNGGYAVARWTAPSSGFFGVEGRFTRQDSTTSDVAVLRNGTVVFAADFASLGLPSEIPFANAVQLSAGDHLDFVVGYGSNHTYYSDATGLTVQISPATNDIAVVCDQPGAYVFRHTATDGELVSSADVVVPVQGSTNYAPYVQAGPDQSIALGATAALAGSVTDDGLPSGAATSMTWSKVSGPGSVTFANAAAAITSASFSTSGTYVLRLSGSDSLLSAADDLVVTVVDPAVNAPPTVNAGADRTVAAGEAVVLTGTLTDDQIPQAAAVHWAESFGPAVAAIAQPDALQTSVVFPAAGTYRFKLFASDSVFNVSDEVAITVTPAPNRAPTVNLGAPRTVPYGTPVTIAPQIGDDGLPDGGVWIDWTVVSGPGSVHLADAEDGAVTAQFGRTGSYVLRLSVSDGQYTTSSDLSVTVTGGSNAAPSIAITGPVAGSVLSMGEAATLTAVASDPENSLERVEFFVDGVSVGSDASAPFASTWTPTSIGAHTLTAVATDGIGQQTTSALVSVNVTVAPPVVRLSAPIDGAAFTPGSTIPVGASASSVAGIPRVDFTVDGESIGSSTAVPYAAAFTPQTDGPHQVTATAYASDGQSSSVSITVYRLAQPADAPAVEISSPVNAGSVTAPVTVLGTADSPALLNWRLEYRRLNDECGKWMGIASGTNPVVNGSLGTFDPTLLLNGNYELRLTAKDRFGEISQSTTDVAVEGDMKVGHFTVAFQDLQLPLAGVPLTVVRTYDSREQCPGDFGYGWRLDVESLRLEKNIALGDGWSTAVTVGTLSNPSTYQLADDAGHLLSVRMPDGELLRFRPKLVMDRPYNRLASLLDPDGDDVGQAWLPIQYNQPLKLVYRAMGGTKGATLRARGYNALDPWLGGGNSIAGTANVFVSDPTEGPISLAISDNTAQDAALVSDATGWELTVKDGRVFFFDADGRLESMRDPVGNTLTFHRDAGGRILSVTHSSGAQVVFHRDASGFVERITDPRGNELNYGYDTAGHLREFYDRVTDPAGGHPTQSFTYRPGSHLLDDLRDGRGIQAARNYYDPQGRLQRTVDATGKETIFTHDLIGRTETIKDRAGNVTVHKYDERGNVVETQTPDGTITRTQYHVWTDGRKSELKESESVTGLFTNDAGQLEEKTYTSTFAYEDEDPNTPPANDGLLRKVTDPLGHSTRFDYDAQGNVLTVTDALGHATANTYYPGTNLVHTTTDAAGNVASFTYDVRGLLDTETRSVTVVDETGAPLHQTLVTDYDYDAAGYLVKVTDPAGHATTYDNDTHGNRLFERTTRTNTQGQVVSVVTEHEYDENDRLVRTWDAEHPRTGGFKPGSEVVFNEIGKPWKSYDALRHVTEQVYNDRGELETTVYADGTSETVSYDADGRREFTTDRRGKTTQMLYDPLGRSIGMVFLGSGNDAAVTLSTTSYDAAGRVYQSTDANNHTSTNIYDAAGRRTAMIDPLNHRSTSQYDDAGNLRFATDAKNHTTEFVYDALNRRTDTIYPPAPLDVNGDGAIGAGEGSVVTSTHTDYDELGRRVAETDQLGRTKRFVYDILGRLTHVVDTAGQVTSYSYDELGNQLTQTDANQHTTRYAYDSLGRRTGRTLPLGQSESLTYNAIGNLIQRTDFNGTITGFGYDALNRLLTRTVAQAAAGVTAADVTFTYTASGQRETMTDASGVTTYGYDSRDRLLTKATPEGTLTYNYDDAGNVASITSSNANGTAVVYRHDELNRLKEVEENGSEITSYGYDEVGNLDHFRTPNGVSHSYTYSALNRLTDLTVSVPSIGNTLATYSYTQLPTGHRSSASEQFAGTVSNPQSATRSSQYQYDTLYRLTAETLTTSAGPAGSVSYGLDPVGNRKTRTSSIAGLSSQSFTYDANDRLNSDHYDNNGNTTTGAISLNATGGESSPQTATDSYNSENRLINRNAANSVQVIYDGDGNKVRETINGQTISYLIDTLNPTGYAQVVEELQNGTVVRTYTYGHDLLLQDQRDGTGTWTATWYGYDGHGSVRFLTDGTGQITDRYDYDSFGTLLASSGTTANRYRYCGEQYDSALGLYYLRARYMNAANGRFWTADDWEPNRVEPKELHRYTYSENDPVLLGDPTGYSAATLGTAVHAFLYVEFEIESNAEGFSTIETNRSIRRIIGSLFGTVGPLALGPDLLRPDLVNGIGPVGSVYEIKPGTFGNVSDNVAISRSPQLLGYIGLLQANTPPGVMTWGPGIWWTAKWGGVRAYPAFTAPGVPPGTILTTYANYALAPGAVTYSFLTPPEEKRKETEENTPEPAKISLKDRFSLGLADTSLTPYLSRYAFGIAQAGIAAAFTGVALSIERSSSTRSF